MPALFLDRDGVLIESVVVDGKPYPAPDVKAVRFVPGAAQLCSTARELGFRLVCVTNQPDVARGTTARETVEEINRFVGEKLGIEDFRVCFHDDADRCQCRKPAPGLLLAAARDHDLDLAASYMIGDRWKDIEAGKRAGCRTIFVDYHYDEAVKSEPDFRISRVADARAILQRGRQI
ncbi:MAG TPA: HAD-IIIA family hydrolase [Spirochaetia bacterium]|nr:HAD-IIIA family hydrolase [Spirochaetia bacterium]